MIVNTMIEMISGCILLILCMVVIRLYLLILIMSYKLQVSKLPNLMFVPCCQKNVSCTTYT